MKNWPWKDWLTANLSYKIIAFFVTLVLWVTLLGRSEFVIEEQVPLQVLVPPQLHVKNRIAKRVAVKVSGPRVALQNFSKSSPMISIDLAKLRPGTHVVEVPTGNMDLPLGVKVLSLDPAKVKIQVEAVEKGQE